MPVEDDDITDSMDMSLSKLREMKDVPQSMGLQKSDTTERLNNIKNTIIFCDLFFSF